MLNRCNVYDFITREVIVTVYDRIQLEQLLTYLFSRKFVMAVDLQGKLNDVELNGRLTAGNFQAFVYYLAAEQTDRIKEIL